LRRGERKRFSRFKLAAAIAIGTDELRVAELADCFGAILLAAGPGQRGRATAT
jgi:hypothetical protein